MTSYLKRAAANMEYFLMKNLFVHVIDLMRLKTNPYPFRVQRASAIFLVRKLPNAIRRHSMEAGVSWMGFEFILHSPTADSVLLDSKVFDT